jgi:hypothetical protein
MSNPNELSTTNEMRLEFVDGDVVCIRLDHGLSFLECVGRCRFDFSANPQAQARAIEKTDVLLRARNDQQAIAYVGE